MKPWALFVILVASLACQLAGLAMFAKGFFPYKIISTEFATHDNLPPVPSLSASDTRMAGVHVRPRFGKVVLMLVDALRSDFLYGNESDFKFMQSLIDSHKAIPFTAIASAPTVTLPRLKALTTGTVPGFLDAILNIAESDQSSTLANQDNWIAQLARSPSLRANAKQMKPGTTEDAERRNIGFFGDDTWIKLFPGLFIRTDGTSSFFAMDTVEVDNNVTRHIEPELAKDDWDGLIFHYLGLDHVGHSGGPKSTLMRPKQAEMDSVAETIYKTLVAKDSNPGLDLGEELPTLFILCGDHGMNEVGNHGGSSRSEISTSFLFMSPIFERTDNRARIQAMTDPYRHTVPKDREEYEYYKSVSQVDLVPTLSILMGLPIPKNSVGKLIPELLLDLTESEKLRALQINAHQVAGVLKNMWPDFEIEASALLEDYEDQDLDQDDNAKDSDDNRGLLGCSKEKSQKQRLACWYTLALADHASFVEMSEPSGGVTYTTRDRSLKFRAAEKMYSKFLEDASSMLSTALSKYDMPLLTNGSLMMAFAVAGFFYCAMQSSMLDDFKASCLEPRFKFASNNNGASRKSKPGINSEMEQHPSMIQKRNKNDINWVGARVLSVLILVLYLVTLFASSFVEEEHQFWYFFNMTWWATLGLISAKYLANTCERNRDDDVHKRKRLSPSAIAAGYCVLQMTILRLSRSWNQTGQKYADQIDLRHYLNSSWLGASWVLFWATISIMATSMIAQIYSIHPLSGTADPSLKKARMPAWKSGLISVLQALLSVLIVLVSLWITVYKMDLESSYFGELAMKRIHSFMSTLSSIGYLNAGGNETLVMSGYEMARGCYAGLAATVILALSLNYLSRSSPSQINLDPTTKVTLNSRTRILFGSSMLLGTTTLLLILLSRRHNAPLFLLFNLQLHLYIEWITLVRQTELAACMIVDDQKVGKTELSLDYTEEDSNTESESAALEIITPRSYFRTLPGQSSIHSCTILLWTLSSFFLLGNSNSIASIDISNAYVGIQAYDIVLTGVLTFVSNWAGPIWWCLGALEIMQWDVELEIAWIKQDKELKRREEEERSWKDVGGWKREDKSTLTRKTKRKIQRYKQAVAKSQETATTAEKNFQEEAKANELGPPQEPLSHSNEENQVDLAALDTDIACSYEESQLDDQDDGETFYVYEEQEVLVNDSSQTSHSLDCPCVLSNPLGFRSFLIKTRVLDHLVITKTNAFKYNTYRAAGYPIASLPKRTRASEEEADEEVIVEKEVEEVKKCPRALVPSCQLPHVDQGWCGSVLRGGTQRGRGLLCSQCPHGDEPEVSEEVFAEEKVDDEDIIQRNVMVRQMLAGLYSSDISDDLIEEVLECLVPYQASRTEIAGRTCYKFLVSLDLFLYSGITGPGKMTQFILLRWPNTNEEVISMANIKLARTLIGAKSINRDYCGVALVAQAALGSFRNNLATWDAIRSRHQVMRKQVDQTRAFSRISGFKNLSHVEDAIMYSFINKELLEDAMCNLSDRNNGSQQALSCQRLEFLGDALLDVFVLEYWLQVLPEGELYNLGKLMEGSVDRGALSAASTNLCLEKHIHYRDSRQEVAVNKIVENLVCAKWEAKLEKTNEPHWRDLGIVGTIFVDLNMSLVTAHQK
ncbi:major facilitator super transporter protein [Mortierella sp. AM989]|nr:major facilitator super transporter protein [Mortierella sp. AM989]